MAGNGAGSIGNVRKKFYETHELISTSYHEAGHTIYGLLHGMNVSGPILVFQDKKDKRIYGATHYDPLDLDNIKDSILLNNRLHAEIGFSYAGLLAEKRYFKMISGSDKFPMFLKEGSSRDFSEGAELFQKYNLSEPGRKRYNYKQKLLKAIDKELFENWDAITLVVHSLFKKKNLSFIELKGLLTKKTKNKDFWRKKFKMVEQLYDNSGPLDEKYMKYILSL